MQYSLKTVMLSILAVAVLLVFPDELFWLVWLLLPAGLVALMRYGTASQRTFALGSLVGYAAIALQPSSFGGLRDWLFVPLSALVLGLSGWGMLYLQRYRGEPMESPTPPPWPDD